MRNSNLIAVAVAVALATVASAAPDPLITPGPQLAPRQDSDPQLVGYISGDDADVRSCDFGYTYSTSGSLAQCCSTAGSCNFYSTCSGNTLYGAGGSVPCDVTSTLTCNTAVVVTSAGANAGDQYIACWQTSLGSNAFTIVRDESQGGAGGSGGSGAASTSSSNSGSAQQTGASSSSLLNLSGTRTASSSGSKASGNSQSSSSTQSTGAAATMAPAGPLGAAALLAYLFA